MPFVPIPINDSSYYISYNTLSNHKAARPLDLQRAGAALLQDLLQDLGWLMSYPITIILILRV